MPLNLKDIGKNIATNPFINPLGSLINKQKTQKELDALKAAQANQGNTNYQPGTTDNYAPEATPSTSVKWPTWAVVSVGVGGVVVLAVTVGLIIKAVKKAKANKA